MTTNTIDSKLQLSEVLDSAMRATKRKLLPLLAFSTVFERVKLEGNGRMDIPYYPLATSASQTRTPGQDYFELATDTETLTKSLLPNKNKVQAVSFTAEERVRQPRFNPEMHGKLKGEKLAMDILADIFSVVRASAYTSPTIAATTAGNFDENDVGDLRQKCVESYWGEGRNLILNPAFGTNLLKQPQIIDASRRGDGGESFRDGKIGEVLGFGVYESAGVGTNNSDAVACTIEADDDVVTSNAHGFIDGDRVVFPTLTGGTGLTAASVAYFVRDATANTFKVSATIGGGAVNVTVDATAGTVRKAEQIAGFACLPSAILAGFAPVPPTEAMRREIFDYQILVDEETGLVLEYLHIAEGKTKREVQVIECHYGFTVGEADQLKLITTPLV